MIELLLIQYLTILASIFEVSKGSSIQNFRNIKRGEHTNEKISGKRYTPSQLNKWQTSNSSGRFYLKTTTENPLLWYTGDHGYPEDGYFGGYFTERIEIHDVKPSTDEEKVARHIFEKYDPCGRPVINASHTIYVSFNVDLINFANMDEVKQILETNVWMELRWYDENFVWNPAKFNGLRFIRQPAKKIWVPDIILHNAAENWSKMIGDRALAKISYNGEVFLASYVKLRSTCMMDLQMYPYDEQLCFLIFGSWSYDSRQLYITPKYSRFNMLQHQDSPVWDYVESSIYSRLRRNPVLTKLIHTDVVVSIRMKRKFLYNNFFNVLAPTICLSALSLFCFWLPSESGEKITLGISLVLTFTLFQLMVNARTPRSSDFIPLVSTYLTVTMSLAAVVICIQVFILNVHGTNENMTRAPYWLRYLTLNILEKLLCCSRTVPTKTKTNPVVEAAEDYLEHLKQVYYNKYGNIEIYHSLPRSSNASRRGDASPAYVRAHSLPLVVDDNIYNQAASLAFEQTLIKKISSAVSRMATREVQRTRFNFIASEWRHISTVLDRLLFWIFLIFVAVITPLFLVIIPQSDYYSHLHVHKSEQVLKTIGELNYNNNNVNNSLSFYP